METTDRIPLWLDIKKEYIDDNLVGVQRYLMMFSKTAQKDSFYNTTMERYRERISELINDIAFHPLYEEYDEIKVKHNASLLATYLLVEGDDKLSLQAYVTLMCQLCNLYPNYSYDIITSVIERITHEGIVDLGYGWDDLSNITSHIVVHRLLKNKEFNCPIEKPLVYSNFGTAFVIAKMGLLLTNETLTNAKNLVNSENESLRLNVGIALRSFGKKLKSSSNDKLTELSAFVKEFIQQLRHNKNYSSARIKKIYSKDDEVVVRISEITPDGTIYVESIDDKYEQIKGKIIDFNVFFYNSKKIKSFSKGDFLTATIVDENCSTFSIEQQFKLFFDEYAKKIERERNNLFVAKLIDKRNGSSRWINEFGITMFSSDCIDLNRGDYAYLSIKGYGDEDYLGKIDAEVKCKQIEEDSLRFEEDKVRYNFIREFVKQTHSPNEDKNTGYSYLGPTILQLLLRILYIYQNSQLNPLVRFRILSHARVIAEMIDDKVTSSYIQFIQTYILALNHFDNDDHLALDTIDLTPSDKFKDAVIVKDIIHRIELLKLYGEDKETHKLSEAIQRYNIENPELAKLAILINASNLLSVSGNKDRNQVILNRMKKEILMSLGLHFESNYGIDLGEENGRQENKSSIIYPPGKDENGKKCQPNESMQNKEIMKGICGFLNSHAGGTLYIGVNDFGRVVGIDEDVEYLKVKYPDLKINKTEDFVRYINSKIRENFNVDIARYTQINQHKDINTGREYIEIKVESYRHGIVYTENPKSGEKVAFIRENSESVPMDEEACSNTLAEKTIFNSSITNSIRLLQKARHEKMCVILKGYASNHSKSEMDRHVEPFKIDSTNNIVWCYDIDKNRNATFKINRIRGGVEIINDRVWQNEDKHNDGTLDIFNISSNPSEPQIHIELKMDLVARNMLIEEYPMSENYITRDENENDKWKLSTDVNRIYDVARFYMGLADCITITNAPELKQEVEKYTKEYLKWAVEA